jgi:hypothetical protein
MKILTVIKYKSTTNTGNEIKNQVNKDRDSPSIYGKIAIPDI